MPTVRASQVVRRYGFATVLMVPRSRLIVMWGSRSSLPKLAHLGPAILRSENGGGANRLR